MARTPGTAFSRAGLSPFRRTSAGFGVFSLADPSAEAYYEFSKVNVLWQNGLADDTEYLSALQTYADSFDTDSAEYVNAQQRVKEARYNIARNKLLAQIEHGTKTYDDLLEFDTQQMLGIEPGSQRYRELRANVESDTNRGAYAAFDKVRNEWQAGKVKDSTYLSAFQTYVDKLTNPDDKENAQLQLEAARYTLERNALVNQVNKGNASLGDLLDFDRQAINTGVIPGSEEYRSRLGRLQETQRAVFSDQERDRQLLWQQGRLTTNQLLNWYKDSLGSNLAAGNQDLIDRIQGQVDSLTLRLTDEKDAKMVEDFNNGLVGANAFLAYARSARDRYATNTPQYRDWQQRIDDATRKTTEDNLLYRYDLTTQYADLKQFVQTHKNPPWAGGSVSEETRWILDENNNWVPQTTSKTTPYTPSEDQQKSWAEVQAQVAEAKGQMNYIEKQIATVPGGWVDTQHMLNYYKGIQNDYTAGSSDWYSIQQRIDTIHERMAQENVWKRVGITINYPWTPNDPQVVGGKKGSNYTPAYGEKANAPNKNPGPTEVYYKSGHVFTNRPVEHGAGSTPQGPGITLDTFMWALGMRESNGNYSARNKTTGAFGKYQILPANWSSWAKTELGNANAPQTPENQEKVVRAKLKKLYDRWGDWRFVALAWHNGHVSSTDPNDWSVRNQKYVNRTMNRLGSDMWTPTNTRGVFLPDNWTAGGGTSNIPSGIGTHPTTVPSGSTSSPGGTAQPGTSEKPAKAPSTGALLSGHYNKGTSQAPPESESVGTKFLRRYNNGQVSAVGLPGWAVDNPDSGTNFSTFYDQFQAAYRSGETSVTIWHSGKPFNYRLPSNPTARATMMAELDQTRIDLYATQAANWRPAGGDAADAADKKWDDAIKDKGQNLLYNLTQEETGNAKYQQTPGNPIADAKGYLESSQKYIDTQTQLAQDYFNKGNYGAAWAAATRAQRRADDTGLVMNNYLAQAEGSVASIKHGTGAPTPEKVQTGLDELRDWDKSFDTSDLDGLVGKMSGTPTKPGVLAGTWREGVFVPALDAQGQMRVQPGMQLTYNRSTGAVVAVPTEDAPVNPLTGLAMGADANKNRVAVTTKIDNHVMTVYFDTEYGVVGQTNTGQDIWGRRFRDQNGNWQFENPFNPGHWNAKPIVINLGANATVIPDPTRPDNSQLAKIIVQTDQGYFTLQPGGSAKGDYSIFRSDPVGTAIKNPDGTFAEAFSSSAGDTNVPIWLAQNGITRDTSFIPSTDKVFVDTVGPYSGFTSDELRQFTSPGPIWRPDPILRDTVTWGGFNPDLRVPQDDTTTWGGFNPNLAVPQVGTATWGGFNPNLREVPPIAKVNPNAGAFTYDKSGKKVPRVIVPVVVKTPEYAKKTGMQEKDILTQEHLGKNRRQPTAAEKKAAAKNILAPAKKPKVPKVVPPPTRKQTFFESKDPFA